MVMRGEFTTVIERRGKWYIGYLEEISGVNSQGRTVEEVKENLKEALSLIIEANRELARKFTEGHDVIREKIDVEI
jgi:predicted RNase H-like HicB family nuclease